MEVTVLTPPPGEEGPLDRAPQRHYEVRPAWDGWVAKW
jgi:hypothetical protein